MDGGNERIAFNKLMTLAFNTYGRAVDGDMQDLYFNLLRGYALQDVTLAVHAHFSDSEVGQFWPKPADLIRKIQGSKGSRALQAWDVAIQAVRDFGGYSTVTFSDPLIAACIARMDGWEAFCEMTEEDKPFVQKRFMERYASYLNNPPGDIPASLPGAHEMGNLQGKHNHDGRAQEARRPWLAGSQKPRILPNPIPALPSFTQDLTPAEAAEKIKSASFVKSFGGQNVPRLSATCEDFDPVKYRQLRDEMDLRERERRLKAVYDVEPLKDEAMNESE